MPSKTGFWNKKRAGKDRIATPGSAIRLRSFLRGVGQSHMAFVRHYASSTKSGTPDGPSSSIAVLILSFALLSRPYGLFG